METCSTSSFYFRSIRVRKLRPLFEVAVPHVLRDQRRPGAGEARSHESAETRPARHRADEAILPRVDLPAKVPPKVAQKLFPKKAQSLSKSVAQFFEKPDNL